MKSPVLWVEGSSDASGQGRSLAIPVEYVCAVIEVKSAFNKSSAKKAVEQLSKLKPLLACVEPPNKPGKLYLPANFFCATVFLELRKEDEQDSAALNELVEATMLRRFYGGYILRAETLDKYYSGKISFRNENIDVEPNNKSLSFWATSKCLKYKEDFIFQPIIDPFRNPFLRVCI